MARLVAAPSPATLPESPDERKPLEEVRPSSRSWGYLSEESRRDTKWDRRRLEVEGVEVVFRGMDIPGFDRWSARLDQCAGVLEFEPICDEDGVYRLKLKRTWFCKVRFCPVCQWRRTLNWQARMFSALPRIEADYPTARWIFLTLTTQNVDVSGVREELKAIHEGFRRMSERKVWPGVGWVRSSEVTRSTNPDPEIGNSNPHLHCLLMVKASYFSGSGYISQKRWTELWRSCARLDYDPVVDVRVVKGKPGEDDKLASIRSAVVETLKYGVKVAEAVPTAEHRVWLREMALQMHNVRQVGVGGELKKYLREEEPNQLEMLAGLDEDDGQADGEEGPRVFYGWRADDQRSPRYARPKLSE